MHDNIWERLRENMTRLTALQERKQDPALVNDKLTARARMLRARLSGARVEPTMTLLSYHKGGVRFGIPIEAVLEVQALDFVTPLPNAPSFLLGVIHWRGVILSLLDMGRLMGLPESGLADVHVSIIVEAAGRRLAVAALEAEDIVTVPLSHVRPPPALPAAAPAEWILGVFEERVLLNLKTVVEDARLTNSR